MDSSWLFRKSGIINHKNDFLQGIQPVRVLHFMNIYLFENTHDRFAEELWLAIQKHGLSKTINITFEEKEILNFPYIKYEKDKSIYIEETFLSYLWCISHTLYTLYIQTIDYPRLNQQLGSNEYSISQEKIGKAYELFDYAKSLLRHYEKWDIRTMPNPEEYLAEDRDFIEQPNLFYSDAVKFILCHEYIHAINHLDKVKEGGISNSHFKEFEKEADYEAIELLKKGVLPSKINIYSIQIGVTIGILSMFFVNETTSFQKHPNTEDRLVTALEQLQLESNSPCWGIALIGIKLWSDQFNLNLNWNKTLSDKKAFYEIISQIKSK